MPPYGDFLLLGSTPNIAEVNMKLSPFLYVQVTPFEETINWLQSLYTSYWTGAYMALASSVLVQSLVLEGDPLFHLI